MSDPTRGTSTKSSPPPAPPLPTFQPRRAGVLQRIVETVGLGGTSRPASRAETRAVAPYRLSGHNIEHIHGYQPLPSQTTAHRTGIPIAALDINSTKTHAVLAGKEILKTVRFEDGSITEDVNLRSNISSTHTKSEEIAKKRRDFLPATDVKWSNGAFANFIATAANHGRIALYDVSRAEIERAWVHEHTGPVHKLAFDPHIGALLLSGSHDGTVRMWDLRTLARASQTMRSGGAFLPRKSGVRDVKWSPTRATDALEFAICTDTGVIQKWDLRKPTQPVLSINAHGTACLSIDWHPDAKHLVSAGLDRLIKVWDFHSDKGNQKAKFELKAPQAIRNVRWRPPCWSSEFAGTGQWQCTQIATSYHQDDPRVHIWDLRRPHLPFRELERYRNPATDLLWANKDLIWTVGDEGWFTQTDVSFAPLIHHSVPPGAVGWFPDGEYAAFAEEVEARRGSGMEDPAVGFLSVPHEKLSSGEEMAISTSFSDDEHEGILPNAFKRRQSRVASAKSGKSQAHTPPTADSFPAVLSLEKAVPDSLFNNKQIGMAGEITGLAADPGVAQFLARRYARPSSEAERKASPGLILERLEAAFNLNADVCDEVSMHRTAQSWRVLGAVIIPELRNWAEKNRAERLEDAALYRDVHVQEKEEERDNDKTGLRAKSPITERVEDPTSEKTKGGLFKGVSGLGRIYAVHDRESTSNVSTPVARPLPDSPVSDINSLGDHYQNLDEALEKLPQLPPSVLASHSTAAAASKALREHTGSLLSRQLSPSTTSDSDESPAKPRHRHAESSQSLRSLQNLSSSTSRPPPQSALLSSPLALRPTSRLPPAKKQEDRRAALRDYQKQARPLLTFDEPSSSPAPSVSIPPQAFTDSSDQTSGDHQNFPLFPASDSSGILLPDGESTALGSSDADSDLQAALASRAGADDSTGSGPDGRTRRMPRHDLARQTGGARQDNREAGARIGGSRGLEEGERKAAEREGEFEDLPQSFGGDSSSDGFRFGMDGIHELVKMSDDGTKPWEDWDEEDRAKEQKIGAAPTSISSAPHELSQFNHESPLVQKVLSQPREYNINPFARQETTEPDGTKVEPSLPQTSLEELASIDFIFHDFRPIDLTKYQPPTPFAWSALPLITQAIAFDLENGPSCAQCSAHLLAHVHPYFFHQQFRSKPTSEILAEMQKYELADRMMHPSLNSRIFENVFAEHLRYLGRTGHYVEMAEFRKNCADFDYPPLYTEEASAIEVGLTTATPHTLSIACANPDCRAPVINGDILCQLCQTLRSVCPICLSLKYDPSSMCVSEELEPHDLHPSSYDRGLWAYCHGCGHSAHLGCLDEWLAHPFSEGECPTSNCGHDCGPGARRTARIDAAMEAENTAKPRKGVQGDKFVVGQSPAVERARKTLRSVDERGTQSGDESGRVRSSFSRQSTGQRKSVRLVTPREEGRE